MHRRTLLAALAAPALARAEEYPARPIRIVIPVVAGGAVDASVRLVQPHLSATLGQPLVLDNRPAGGGTLATEIVARSAPDGYTLLLGTVQTMAVNVSLYRSLPADPVRDFAPISMLVKVAVLLAVPTDRPWRSVPDLVAALKARPGQLSYGSAGVGSAGHLSGALLDKLAGTEAIHVPYRGGGQLIADLMSGKVDFGFATAATVLPQVEAGRLRALAVPSSERSSLLPEVPTMAEAGVAGYAINNWYGVFAPAATPAPVLGRLNGAVGAALRDPEVVAKMAPHALEPYPSTPEAAGALIRSEIIRYREVVRAANITAQ
jgi:tripartite-type tricarboxylate transporter receptor subunit TctC